MLENLKEENSQLKVKIVGLNKELQDSREKIACLGVKSQPSALESQSGIGFSKVANIFNRVKNIENAK